MGTAPGKPWLSYWGLTSPSILPQCQIVMGSRGDHPGQAAPPTAAGRTLRSSHMEQEVETFSEAAWDRRHS